MKHRRQISLALLGLVLIALGLGAWQFHYQPKRALADYRRELVAAGEKLTIPELLPNPVPSEQNSADIFLKAASRLNRASSLLATNQPPAMRMVAPGKAMVGWQQPHIRNDYEGVITNTWEEAGADLARYAEGLELLHQIIENPQLDFGLDYQQGFSLLLPNLAQTKTAAQCLSAAAACQLHRGDTAAATKNIRAMLALVKGSADERLVISQLVRMAIAAITLNANWELLQSPQATDAQLAGLQREWTELEFLQALEHALEMERAIREMSVAQMRNSSAGFNRVVSGYAGGGVMNPPGAPGNWYEAAEQFVKDSWDKTRLKTRETAWRVAWSYPDQLRALKGDQVLLESIRAVRTNACFDAAFRSQQSRLDALGIEPSISNDDQFGLLTGDLDLRSLFSQSVLSLTKVLKRVMTIETSRQMMITAIALKRYQLRHGNYPPALAALTPEFLPTPPRDPVDGQPLRYRRDGNKLFVLYSVGENVEDNGGDPKPLKETSKSLYWQQGRDWVWPQPADAAEVEAYYDSQAKRFPQRAALMDTNQVIKGGRTNSPM